MVVIIRDCRILPGNNLGLSVPSLCINLFGRADVVQHASPERATVDTKNPARPELTIVAKIPRYEVPGVTQDFSLHRNPTY